MQEIFSDKSYDDLILDLNILSKLKTNQKLCIIDKKLCIDIKYFKSITRYYNDDSRVNTINYLECLDKKLKNELEKLIKTFNDDKNDEYLQETNTNILINLNHYLKLSLFGINNLIQTYINDEVVKSRIELLIKNIELKNRKITELLVVKN